LSQKLATTRAIENLRWRDNPKVIPITRIANGVLRLMRRN
jgi:hypothetical protein